MVSTSDKTPCEIPSQKSNKNVLIVISIEIHMLDSILCIPFQISFGSVSQNRINKFTEKLCFLSRENLVNNNKVIIIFLNEIAS